MATGRDAADVAMTTSFGNAELRHFYVESQEVLEDGTVVSPLAVEGTLHAILLSKSAKVFFGGVEWGVDAITRISESRPIRRAQGGLWHPIS